MSGDFAVMIVFLGLFFSLAFVIKIVSDNWTKKRALEAGASEQTIRAVFRMDRDPMVLTSLKWGMVAVGLGLALLLADVMNVSFQEAGPYGGLLLFGGAALILYYWIARKMLDSPSGPEGSERGGDGAA